MTKESKTFIQYEAHQTNPKSSLSTTITHKIIKLYHKSFLLRVNIVYLVVFRGERQEKQNNRQNQGQFLLTSTVARHNRPSH